MTQQRRTGAMLRLAAVVVFLGGQLGALAHNAFVQHRVCPEHGELEDVGSGPDSTASAVPKTVDRTMVSAGSESSGEHDHCAAASVTRERTCQSSAAGVVVLAPARAGTHAYGLDRAIASRPIYRLAPKQSPPA